MGTSPSLVTWNVRWSVSCNGQKPKSKLAGTLLEMVGMDARIGTTNEPVSVMNSTQSSYASRRSGLKLI